jgi:ADP-ribosylglycohydrolase
MLGAIAGDIIGSVYENRGVKTTAFPLFTASQSRFTDDTVLTLAVAAKLLGHGDYVDLFHDYFAWYPAAGYGGSFLDWAASRQRTPYNSYGNGSAMRASPIGHGFATIEETASEARRSAEVTHNHPEGIRGAQAAAVAVHLARVGADKLAIQRHIEQAYGYHLGSRLADIRPRYRFDVSCQGSVPQAILAFLESNDYESAVRNAISLGGDADTMACIAGGIAEAFYGGVPASIRERSLELLDDRLRSIVYAFEDQFPLNER